MKTKNFKLILKLIAIPSILVFTVLTAFANYGSFGNPPNPPVNNCVTFHDVGYTGGTGANGTDYPNGTPFATFNGYRDAETVDGRPFNERQFAYIEINHANGDGLFPRHSGQDYTPWVDWAVPSYSFNSPQATNYNFQFTNNPNDKYYVGVWGYMHNNGTADTYTANNVKIKLTGFNDTTPQLSHSPKYTITASNTCPQEFWADVEISGDRAFTMNLDEFYVFREPPLNSGLDYQIGDLSNNALAKQNLTTTGFGINSRQGLTGGTFESSEIHWVAVYAEFEVVPEEAGVCRNLTITDPSQTLVNIDENGFDDTNLEFTVDTDPNTVTGYRVLSTEGTVDFANSGQSDYELNGENNTQTVMDGGPSDPNSPDTVQVWALDNNGNEIPECFDSFLVNYDEEEGEPVCEVFATDPGSAGSQQVDIGVTTIELDGPRDNNGDPYRPNGQIPNIRYCYSNDGITFMPDSGNVVHPGGDLRCAVAPETDTMVIDTTETGTMTIEVVEDPDNCNDTFKTDFEYGGKCLLLEFVQDEFNMEDETEYCVTLDVESTVQDYDDHIQWEVERDGDVIFEEDTRNTLCIDLDDYSYDFQPGDTLTAQALDIDYDGNDCEDRLESEELVCLYLELDTNTFERGRDNEVCIEDIDPNDWPINSTGLEVEVDGDYEGSLDVDDDCFILDEDLVEDADEIEVWVDGYRDECADELRREVRPPDFSKNVKDQDGAVFSTRAIANFSDSYVDYRIKYEHRDNGVEQDVVITDTIGIEGYIQGYIANPNDSNYEDRPEGGRIYYEDGSMNVYVEGEGNISDCDNTSGDLCYNGNIGDRDGVEIENVPDGREVVITYRGRIESEVNPENCANPDHPLWETGVCGEFYPNTAYFEDETPFEGSDDAEVVIPCPFFIIRSGGEVFMENPFDYGIDTLACSEIENVPSPFVVPDYEPPTSTPSTGAELEGIALIQALDDRLCKSENAQEAGYGGENRASSLICELTLKTSEELTQYVISQNIQRNIDLFARYDKDLNNRVSVNGSNDLPSNTSDVYVKDNGDLELSGSFSDGAQTIVVLGHDVKITGNITLDDSSANISDPRTIPSLAVIVIGGDVLVSENVEETNGVFFIMENADREGGQMCEKDCADDDALSRYNDAQYTHYGSIYGDIEHLFKYRTFAGDPTQLEAAVLIKFDSRIFLNTPPLLNELVDVSQQVF